MNARNIRIVVTVSIALAALILSSCQTTKTEKSQGSWPEKMQKMSAAVSDLLPYVYSRSEFQDPKNSKKVKKAIRRFASAVHAVPPKMGEKILGEDPIIKYSLNRLDDDVKRAIKSYDMGHKEYARSLLRGSVGYCFNCHSRTGFGPEYTISSSVFTKLKLEPTEKADVYVATRQYDKALEVLKAKLNDPINFYEDPYELERALKKYLAVTVRVKQDPSIGINTIDKFLERKNVPYYLAEDAQRWEKSLRRWVGDRSKKVSIKRAEALIKRAADMQSNYTYQSGNMEYLRASAMLHDLLRMVKTKKELSKVYELLGKSYEILADLGFWNLPELYFEACIRELPKSKTAKSCYKSFEKNVIFGFSGSAGIFIPAEERARLSELKTLAGF